MKRINSIIESPYEPKRTDVMWAHNGVLKYFRNGHWVATGDSQEGMAEIEEKIDSLDKEMGEVKNDLGKFGSAQGVVELQIGNSSSINKANLSKLQSIQSTDHTFFADIDYGYGTGQWLPTTGGSATIFTSAGHMVKYTISKEGSVTKAEESTLGGSDIEIYRIDIKPYITIPDLYSGKINEYIYNNDLDISITDNTELFKLFESPVKHNRIILIHYDNSFLLTTIATSNFFEDGVQSVYTYELIINNIRYFVQIGRSTGHYYISIKTIHNIKYFNSITIPADNRIANQYISLTTGVIAMSINISEKEVKKFTRDLQEVIITLSSEVWLTFWLDRGKAFSSDIELSWASPVIEGLGPNGERNYTYRLTTDVPNNRLYITGSPIVIKANTTNIGGVKQVSAPAILADDVELAQVTASVNNIIDSLIFSGVFERT